MPDASLDHVPTAAHRHITRLTWALVISLVILITELVAGIASNSLALLADAGHVFADVSGMAFALVAVRLAARPRTDERTFGLYRLEIVAAAANAILLLLIAAFVFYEAIRRLFDARVATGANTPKDAKTRLQELLQGHNLPLPAYDLVGASGEDHARVFEVTCSIENLGISARGNASSRRAAEQIAAEQVLEMAMTRLDDER
jgi:uncharacterized iron-regulated membrane protein